MFCRTTCGVYSCFLPEIVIPTTTKTITTAAVSAAAAGTAKKNIANIANPTFDILGNNAHFKQKKKKWHYHVLFAGANPK